MTKSILVLHTAHFLLSDAKHLSYVSAILTESGVPTMYKNNFSSTHFKYFTSFFRAVSDVQLPIMFIFKSSIARQRINIRHYVYCLTVLWTISCLVACMYLCRREFFCTSYFTCAFFTRAFHTCGVYMPIPLPAQSI